MLFICVIFGVNQPRVMKAQAKTRANHFVTGMLMKSKKSLSTSGPELREREKQARQTPKMFVLLSSGKEKKGETFKSLVKQTVIMFGNFSKVQTRSILKDPLVRWG